uniref:Squamosa promoter-binding protein n=1 Tax=Rhizophora mucronata TaxID=61149 RepID=A0A2P2LXE5_RHIMU
MGSSNNFSHIDVGMAINAVKIVHPGRMYPSSSTGILANHWNICECRKLHVSQF